MRRVTRGSVAGAIYRRILTLVAIIGIIMGLLVFWTAKQEIDRSSDAQLITAANALYALMQDELHHRGGEPQRRNVTVEIDDSLLSKEDAQAFHASADWRMFAVFDHGQSVLHSDIGPPVATIPRLPGFHDFGTRGKRWRGYGLAQPKFGLLLVVAERTHARALAIRGVADALILPFLTLLAGSAALLWLFLGNGLSALRRLSSELAGRSVHDLHAFAAEAWPEDLRVLIASLNRLFYRVGQAFEHERSFTDNAAHQLRTPLATLKLQAQMMSATGDQATQARLLELGGSIDRAVALVDRMLVLSRLDAFPMQPQKIDLLEVVAGVIAEHALVASRSGVELMLQAADPVSLVSDPDLIRVALAALLENAVKYAPTGSAVEICISSEGAEIVEIAVGDRGPGIPPAARELVVRRFFQLSENRSGNGLGLAIAARATETLGARLLFADRDDGRGLVARILLPGAASEGIS